VLSVVPLRARRDAIPALAVTLLAKAIGPGRTPPRLGSAALAALAKHDWPGNVRELRTVMERAVVLCEGDEVRASHILFDAPGSPEAGAGDAGSPEAGNGDAGERERILAALDASAGKPDERRPDARHVAYDPCP